MMKFKKKSNFINFFHIKQIVVKRIETKLEEKTNWRAALKIWRAKHGNQGGEKKKTRKGCQCQTRGSLTTHVA